MFKKILKMSIFSLLTAFSIGLLFYSSSCSPKALAKSEDPEFCVQCHVMEAQYEAWIHSGAHRRNRCIDCHLPNENMVVHYVWKTIDGVRDAVVFYSGSVPEMITLSSHGEKVLQENCLRCHEAVVSMMDRERKCWKCHRNIMHKLTGTMETL